MKIKKLVASLTTLLAMSTIAGTAVHAVDAQPTPDMLENIIQGKKTATLTIHKHQQPVTPGTTPTGTVSQVDTPPLSDVTFEVKRVSDLDITTAEGWTRLTEEMAKFQPTQDFKKAYDFSHFTFDAPVEKQTTADGSAVFADLPLGLYVVTEKLTDEQKLTIDGAVPFLVALPMTNPARNAWNYDVHAYPKNQVLVIEKKVNDQDTHSANDITYTIPATIPGGGVTDKYVVRDVLDTKLTYTPDSVTVQAGADALLPADFEVRFTQDTNTLEVELTQTGREKAYAALQASADAKVEVSFKAVANAPGEISNVAVFWPNKHSFETNTDGHPTPPVVTKHGGIKIKKVSKDGVTPLAGAKFDIYMNHTNDFSTAKLVKKDAITTTQTGEGEYKPLRYSNFADNETVTEDSGKYNFYWLVETQAPEGHELLPQPLAFTVDSAMDAAPVMVVKNNPTPGRPHLPLTGANAGIMFSALSLGVLGLGAVAVKRSRKQEN